MTIAFAFEHPQDDKYIYIAADGLVADSAGSVCTKSYKKILEGKGFLHAFAGDVEAGLAVRLYLSTLKSLKNRPELLKALVKIQEIFSSSQPTIPVLSPDDKGALLSCSSIFVNREGIYQQSSPAFPLETTFLPQPRYTTVGAGAGVGSGCLGTLLPTIPEVSPEEVIASVIKICSCSNIYVGATCGSAYKFNKNTSKYIDITKKINELIPNMPTVAEYK